MNGKWVKGPGGAFFDAISASLGKIPFIAEDLGDIDADVHRLRDAYDLPGMKIMHFAFGDDSPDHPFRPHTYPERCVAYTGTHDNNTTRGWFDALPEHDKHRVRTYFSSSNADIVHNMMSSLLESRADLAVLPAQDLWGLGAHDRMNTPATAEGNWAWRMSDAQLSDDATFAALGELTASSRRAHSR